ncbi:hypothetical protein O6H91_03G101700 [Diphasiastrum complanatum]|uniref:Uncharacterized protein n=1 Tax=Diphasiastrum complanatum TaxID=34168 RepID=A0ACC2E9S9_DIPCM|nr:hypothetical protein O6H91_03G101700 [Diphasiastrum complanatum]
MLNQNTTFLWLFNRPPPPCVAARLKQQCKLWRWSSRSSCYHKTTGITIPLAAASADHPSFTLITPTRLFPQSTTLRLVGSVSTPAHGFGKILALDEFFSGPSKTPLPNHDGLQETIIYHLSEAMASNLVEVEEEAELTQPQHGLQLYIKSSLQLPVCNGSQTTPVPDHSLISHLKDASSVPAVLLEDADGGARVKVIAGNFGGLASSLPQDQSLMLDVKMRPGSHVEFPLESSFNNLVYVLEVCSSHTLNKGVHIAKF